MQDDLKLHYLGWLETNFSNLNLYNELFEYIKSKVFSFYNGDINSWNRSYSGAYDHINDRVFVDFIKSNKFEELISSLLHNEYKLGNIFLRIWMPGSNYLNWHRDSYFRGKKLTGRFPPDINIFYYPTFTNFNTPQLKIISKSHRTNFDNNFLEKLQCIFSKKIELLNSNKNAYIVYSSILHGLPNMKDKYKKEFRILKKKDIFKGDDIMYGYPRLIIRFCSQRNLNSYRLGN